MEAYVLLTLGFECPGFIFLSGLHNVLVLALLNVVSYIRVDLFGACENVLEPLLSAEGVNETPPLFLPLTVFLAPHLVRLRLRWEEEEECMNGTAAACARTNIQMPSALSGSFIHKYLPEPVTWPCLNRANPDPQGCWLVEETLRLSTQSNACVRLRLKIKQIKYQFSWVTFMAALLYNGGTLRCGVFG